MKRALWILAVAILVAGPARAAEPEGFGALRWGDPPPRGGSFAQRGESQICSKRARPKTLGSARLESAEYEFVSGGLVGVALFARDRSDFSALKGELESRFGGPGMPSALPPTVAGVRWEGAVTRAELYDLGPGTSAVLFLTSARAQAAPGGLGAPAEERALQTEIRLFAHRIEAVDRRIAAETKRAIDVASVEANTQHLSCKGWSAPNEDRDLVAPAPGSAREKGSTLTSLRERLQKEKGQLEAQLSALRGARAAAGQSAPAPTAP